MPEETGKPPTMEEAFQACCDEINKQNARGDAAIRLLRKLMYEVGPKNDKPIPKELHYTIEQFLGLESPT